VGVGAAGDPVGCGGELDPVAVAGENRRCTRSLATSSGRPGGGDRKLGLIVRIGDGVCRLNGYLQQLGAVPKRLGAIPTDRPLPTGEWSLLLRSASLMDRSPGSRRRR